jgi:hypothetical protein
LEYALNLKKSSAIIPPPPNSNEKVFCLNEQAALPHLDRLIIARYRCNIA